MKVNFDKFNFFVDDGNYLDFWNNYSSWEKKDLLFVSEYGKENKIFIDIGAWIGPYTLLAAKMGMKVYAFEPDKIAFEALKKNIELNNFKYTPKIFNYGLSAKDTKAYLYSNSNQFGKSESGLINYKNFQGTKKIKIDLKNFLHEVGKIKMNNMDKEIQILKIDIEGGEFLIEKDIYNFVNSENLYCIFSYHHMVFNNNKFKKNFYKIRTLFYQSKVEKIFPSKEKFKIANIFRSKDFIN